MAKKKTTTKHKPTRGAAATSTRKEAKTVKKKAASKKVVAKKVAGKASRPAKASKAGPVKKAVKAAAKLVRKPVAKPARARKIKTKMGKKDLLHYRALLLVKRAELVGDIGGLADAALRGKDTSNLSTMPLHMADVGSDNYDQDLMLGLMESERKLLIEIDEALHRIAEGTFGICDATGKPINKTRLEAKPWAKYCIEAAREMERNGNGNGNGNGR